MNEISQSALDVKEGENVNEYLRKNEGGY